MILGLITLITALTISAVAIYYSVAGLVAIFAAAALPIIIMGGTLEVAKLVTAVWLHRYWSKATWWLKTYLTTAVLMLMIITSMGIFGFLSKAHIEQTTASVENVEQITRLETEIARQEAIIARAEEKIIKAEQSTGNLNENIQSQIDKEQERIDSAYARIQPAIDEQNAIVQTQLSILEEKVAVYEDQIESLDQELQRYNQLVNDYRTQLASTNVESIEEQVEPYLNQIAQLDNDLELLNTQANEYEQRISNLQLDTSTIETLKTRIANIEENIVVTTNKLQSNERDKIKEGQAVIGVTDDGLFGGNTRRALTAWVEAQQERIAQLQAQETDLRTQAQSTLGAERNRLTELVKDLRGAQTDAIQKRKETLLQSIDQVRASAIDNANITKKTIQEKIDAILTSDIPNNRQSRQTAQEKITVLRQADDPRIVTARNTISQLRASADAQITASNELIQRLRDKITVGASDDIDAIIDDQSQRIRDANTLIDSMTEQKYGIEAEYRKLEAEVGPIKYIAEFIYDEADKDVLEEAVRWVIILIIFVFDPLAVLLLIASQYTFEYRKIKDDSGDYHRPDVIDPTPKASEEKLNDNINRPDDGRHDWKTEYARAYTGRTSSHSSESQTNYNRREIEGVHNDTGASDNGRVLPERVLESTKEKKQLNDTQLFDNTVNELEDDRSSLGDNPGTRLQENNVDDDEQDVDTSNESNIRTGETVDETTGQVSNTERLTNIPDTRNKFYYKEELDSKKKTYITKQEGIQIKKKL